MSYASWVMRLVWKDIVVELRRKELVYASIFFAGVVLLVFAFSFLGGERPTLDVAAGVLWVTVALTGTLGIGRAFEREREGDTWRALLLSPLPRTALYVGKLVSLCLLMSLVVATAAFGVGLLFGAPLADHLGGIALLLVLGVVGFSAIASLFAASLGRSRSRDLLLPLIVYPLVVPVLIAGARGTAGLLTGEDPALPAFWMRFLFVFDLIFVTLGLWTFEPLAASEG
ncbi:MAG: heme exporter protein CcmB [Polyangia bacterium]